MTFPPRALLSILLVEDNPGDIRLMREALVTEGISSRLSVVEDGEAALCFLYKKPPYSEVDRPDLIFLDLNLPRKDGREVLAQVKNDAALRSIPVIVLTTSEAYKDVQQAYELHANCYIRKPSDLDEYMRVIRTCEHFWCSIVKLPA